MPCCRYNKEALRLRIYYLLNQPPGAESHTILCTDVPGVVWGTIPNRADGTLLKVIPKGEGLRGEGKGGEERGHPLNTDMGQQLSD